MKMPWRPCCREQKDDKSQVARKKIKGTGLEKKMLLTGLKQCNYSWGKNEGVAITNIWSLYSRSKGHIIRSEGNLHFLRSM